LPYFLTFKQVKRLKGSVIKDEKAHMVVFYKWLEKKDEDGNAVVNAEGKPEMGAAFLCGEAGIANRTIDNSAAYIQG
jgi:antirestriction protein ArdC